MAQSLSPDSYSVLVVEDDPALLFLVMEMVEREGLKVHGAADAEEAVVVLQVHENIAALITDVEMPGRMNGIELAHFVQSRWPQIRIFVTSGRQRLSLSTMPTDAIFVPKPFGFTEIRKVLDLAGF